jgi:hypothetical protein
MTTLIKIIINLKGMGSVNDFDDGDENSASDDDKELYGIVEL